MKHTRQTILILAIAATVLVAGCGNPFNQNLVSVPGAQGSLQLTVEVPNYQEPRSRAISPDSRYLEIYVYNGDEPGNPALSGDLYWYEADSPAANGFFYTTYDREFFVQAGTYETLSVTLYNRNPSHGATVLTSGSVSNVTITAGTTTQISVALTPPEGMFTPLVLGTPVDAQFVAGGSMVFYSFPADLGESYEVSITPSFGDPDVYVFDANGRRPGVVLAQEPEWVGDRAHSLGAPVTFATYSAEMSGTYFLGVYGWIDSKAGTSGDAEFSIGVTAAAIPVARPAAPAPPQEGTVAWYVDQAIEHLRDGRFDEALASFTDAVLVPGASGAQEYGVALAGFNALYLMTIVVDPAIVTVARDNLGLADYPSDMTALLSGEWMQRFVDSDGWDMMFPRVIGQEDLDGDGVISLEERLTAMGTYFVANNYGFDTIANAALGALGSRLEAHVANLKSTDPEANIAFTWDMVYDHLDEIVTYFDHGDGRPGFGWPVDDHRNPIDVIIARDDLLVLASWLNVVRSMIHLAKVYDLDMTQALLQDYWSTFNPHDGTAYNDPPSYIGGSPFATGFLGAKPDSATNLAAARTAFVTAMTDLEIALYGISARQAGGPAFLISPASPVPGIADDWNDIRNALSLAAEEVVPRLGDSADNNTGVYFPLNLIMDGDVQAYRYGNWPEVYGGPNDPEPTLAVNVGRFFTAPFSGLVDMTASGEPAWYRFTPAPASFTEISVVPDPFDGDLVYLRIPDVTLGGLISVDDLLYLPMDDPATRYRLSLDYWDMNWNGYWDPGEPIHQLIYSADIEGLINTAVIDLEFEYPGGDPQSYYDSPPTLDDFTDEDLIYAGIVATADYAAALRVAVAAEDYANEPRFRRPAYDGPPIAVLQGSELYISAPTMAAWTSLAPAGSVATDDDGYSVTATGSIWTFLLTGQQWRP